MKVVRLTVTYACVLFAVAGCIAGCKDAAKHDAPAAPAAPAAPDPAAAPKDAKPAPAGPAAAADANADEACGQMILVAYQGAAHAKSGITRDKAEAAKRAQELIEQVRSGADFVEVARSNSDAPSSAQRGGIFGTFKKDRWPALHMAVRDPLFELKVGQLAPSIVEADYGFAILRRCPVEKAHARHILIRYRGATGANARIVRSKATAQKDARNIASQLRSGADFAQLAMAASEDGSASRGGDIGTLPRGALAWQFENALFALKPGERSDVVETEFGFHIIERLPD
jgi:parvulin-like peptidyl-prolyl isomerase